MQTKYIVFLLTCLIYNLLKAQQPILDTLFFTGKFKVQCACTKGKIAVLDLISIEDTVIVNRFIFDYKEEDSLRKFDYGDSVYFDQRIPYIKNSSYGFVSRYLIENSDSVSYYVYQPSYTELPFRRLFFLQEPFSFLYAINNKCPNSILRRKSIFTRIDSWVNRTF